MIFTKNKEGVRAIRAIEYKKYVAGKYTRARARKCTNRIQLFRERLSEKSVHATIPKGNMGYD